MAQTHLHPTEAYAASPTNGRGPQAAPDSPVAQLEQQKSFLEILLAVSSRLITVSAQQLDVEITTTLGEIGSFLHADRMYIVDYHFARGIAVNTHEWCAPGNTPLIQNLQAMPLTGLDAWVARHRRGEVVQISNVHALDPTGSVRQLLDPLGMHSMLTIPLLQDGVCVGFVGLAGAQGPRCYGESDQQLLQFLAQLLANLRNRITILKALAASEKRYRQIVETAQEGISLIDLDGRIVYANQRWADMLGYSLAEVIGADFRFCMDPDVKQEADYHLARRRQGIKEQHDFRLRRKDGSDLWVIVNTNVILDDAGRPLHVMGTFTDVTARKQAEAALQDANRLLEQRIAVRTAELQEERSLLRTVIDAIPDSIYVKDRQHRLLLNNRAHIQAVGATSSAELLGKTDFDLFPQALAHQSHADEDRLLASGQPIVNLEEHVVRPDSSEAWMLTTKAPLRNLQGEIIGLVGVTHDITALKAAEAVTEAALAREMELGELKSRLVSMASHEFRNPLAAILGSVDVLALMWDQMDKAKIYDRLNRIRDQALRLTAITGDVLQLTRLQTGRGRFEPALGDLDELVACVVNDLAELPGNQGRIHYDCARRPLPAVFDARLLHQAMSNLLHNALKYSPPDKCVRITLAQAPGQTGRETTLCIADEGIGIPPEDLSRLFEPFHRAANVGAIQGTGLGLSIVKEAVELHGGTIAVESHLGAGTTFTITLPESEQIIAGDRPPV